MMEAEVRKLAEGNKIRAISPGGQKKIIRRLHQSGGQAGNVLQLKGHKKKTLTLLFIVRNGRKKEGDFYPA